MKETSRAIVLLSGGLDSATTLALAISEGYCCTCLSFDYGQRHSFELEASQRVAQSLGVESHIIAPLDMRAIGGSALTDDIDVPTGRSEQEIGDGIPITYVPARNLIFLSLACAYAEVGQIADLFIGVNAVDYSGYPDCRPEFVEAFELAANLATKTGSEGRRFRIHTPLVKMSKADIIRTGVGLGVDYAITHSCYRPTVDGAACGDCDSCRLRRRGFFEAGVPDPTVYAGEPVA